MCKNRRCPDYERPTPTLWLTVATVDFDGGGTLELTRRQLLSGNLGTMEYAAQQLLRMMLASRSVADAENDPGVVKFEFHAVVDGQSGLKAA